MESLVSMENTTSVISCTILAPLQGTLCSVSIAIGFLTTSLSSPHLILLLAMVLFRLLINQKLKCQRAKQLSLPPGPKLWPVVGCLRPMLTNRPTFRWIHKLMEEMNTGIACIRLGNVHVIPVTSPEITREFLKPQDAVFARRPSTMSTHLTSRGYLTTSLAPLGEQRKKMKRALVTEFFLRPNINGYTGKDLKKLITLFIMCITNARLPRKVD
ncbi:conserved hypothetical protein [Ricinus communis]|uniref:Cytochrome P450 n=1 Tax=Ricinus communis TaxID=3988 RepID=B9S5E5_RICCO|nr:conserved hypothetical protein [Ricinus communis]